MPVQRIISVAPMMDYTDRHDRYFLRLISKNTWLYTEMITTNALLKGEAPRFLRYDDSEHPLAIQLGGSDPVDLASCSKMAEDSGYDEVNLNVGCPSDRVQSGCFGASLMADPDLVARCIEKMAMSVKIPVTVKCRLGIDHQDDYAHLKHFIHTVSQAGCSIFIIHARKAWLQGLSPKANRDVPPLKYEFVHQIKAAFPHLEIIINGGLHTLEDVKDQLDYVDGAMIGRAVYNNPYLLAEADQKFFGATATRLKRKQILEQFIPYVDRQLANGMSLTQISRHVLGLFQGLRGAKAWRRHISENAHKSGANSQLLLEAAKLVEE